LEEDTELNWINVNKVAIDTGCVSQYDENEELQCIFDGNTVIILVAMGPISTIDSNIGSECKKNQPTTIELITFRFPQFNNDSFPCLINTILKLCRLLLAFLRSVNI